MVEKDRGMLSLVLLFFRIHTLLNSQVYNKKGTRIINLTPTVSII